jgi:O-antigen biosynthesis protein WbqP
MNKKIKKIIKVGSVILFGAFVVMRIIAKKQQAAAYYEDEPLEQNQMKGKKVVFVEDEDDEVNADGKQGHLESTGLVTHYPTFYEKFIKRGFDVVLSFFGMVFLAPVYAITAIFIKKDDPGPAMFCQKRVGENKRYFKLYKFRSMRLDTPKNVPTHMLDNPDQYILKSGKIIRKLSIDELPQLWNIFIGNMSIIGPRPALWNQDYLTAERDKYGANDIKPGLTGLAQIKGRDELEIPEKAKLDGVYANALKESSLSGLQMDTKILFGSVYAVLKSKGVVEGGTGQMAKEFEKANAL